ncbi:MAG: response regulator transcription factor [Burkholderiaceae bacterium]
MKLLLVDDHELFRAGLKFILEDFEESVDFLEASSTEEAAAFQDQPIDLILLDLGLHGRSGLDALDAIRKGFTDATIVVLSSDEDPVRVRMCIEQGASGYIPKSSSQDVMIQALRLVLAGGIYLPPLSIGHYPVRTRTDAGTPPAQGRPMPGRGWAT